MLRIGLIALLIAAACTPVRAQEGVSPQTACAAAMTYNADHQGVSFLVLRDGQIVCEDYPNGGAAAQPYVLASGTKSFTGLIAAAAVQDGLLSSLDERVSDTITEWRDDPARNAITVRHLLSLTSGLESGDNGAPPAFAQAITARSRYPAGEHFEYGPAPFQVFGEVMRRKLLAAGRASDPLAYLQERILTPIGVTPRYWRRDENGMPNMPSGAALTARQWAAVGEFVRNGGVVDGRQLVDAATLSQLFRGSAVNPGYGLSWWLPGRANMIDPRGNLVPGGPDGGAQTPVEDAVMAAGAGNQRLYVIPSRHLVIVRQTDRQAARQAGRHREDDRFSDAAFLAAVLDHGL
jgi:CubicO group peptidase (beta-lactamase class C family)